MSSRKPYVEAILTFDGKHMVELRSCVLNDEFDDEDIDALIEFSKGDAIRIKTASTWILKNLIENGRGISARQLSHWATLAQEYDHWESAIHFCQSIKHLQIQKREFSKVVAQLERFLEHPRPLVGVWALDGLVHLSDSYSDLVPKVARALDKMSELSKPSVKARIRNLIKKRPHLR